jgi:hypothetical protein
MSRKVRTRRILLAVPFILGLVFVLSLIPFYSNAQVTSCPGNILKNGDFTSFTAGGDLSSDSVKNWVPSSNTPQLAPELGCGNPGFIRMWGNKVVGESISQTGLPIKKGHSYKLSACVKWSNNNSALPQYVRANVRASNGIPGYTATGPTAPTIGIIGDLSNTPPIAPPGIISPSWMTVELPTWIATEDFNTITINPENNSSADDGNQVSWLDLDNVCLVEVFPPEFKAVTSCQGTSFTTSAGGPWFWNFGDSATSNLQNPTHTYANGGGYNVKLCAGTNTNCITKPVTIAPGPPPPVITGPTSSCGNQTATYSVPATSGVSYSWSVTNGTITGPSNTNSVSVTWNSPGAGTISVTVTNKSKCSSTATLKVADCDLHLGECCQQFRAEMKLHSLVHLGNGLYNFNTALWVNQPVTRVTAEIISSSITTPSECGTSGPTSGYVTSAGNVMGFTSVVPVYNGHEALWFGAGVSLTSQPFPMQIKFPPPPTGKCRDELTFCVKYTFTDKNCKTCEIIRCYGPIKRGGPIKIPEEIKNIPE